MAIDPKSGGGGALSSTFPRSHRGETAILCKGAEVLPRLEPVGRSASALGAADHINMREMLLAFNDITMW